MSLANWIASIRYLKIKKKIENRCEGIKWPFNSIENVLLESLMIIAKNTSNNSSRRVTAVRWFNRLYYDLSAWQKEHVEIMYRCPTLQKGASKDEILQFRRDYIEFSNKSVEFTRGGKFHFNPLEPCSRIKFLQIRLPVDFKWLSEDNNTDYFLLKSTVDRLVDNPSFFFGLIYSVQHFVIDNIDKYLDESNEYRHDYDPLELINFVDNYAAESMKFIEEIRELTEEIGIKLLSIEEYEAVLTNEAPYNSSVIILGSEVNMSRDTYNVGQAGAVGPFAQAIDTSINVTNNNFKCLVDLDVLADELALLRTYLKKEAVTPEQDIVVSDVARAEQAARKKDVNKVIECLKNTGQWALDVATNIGTAVAIAAIKDINGLK